MDNTYKLIIVVLSFFLALTFVSNAHAIEPREIVFNGQNTTTVSFISSNPLLSGATPDVQLIGPFTLEKITGNTLIAKNGSATISVTLKPISGLRVNDVYTGLARIRWGTQLNEIPLRIRVVSPANAFSPGAFSQSLSGLVILPAVEVNLSVLLNVILVIVIIVLVLGLVLRIKHRLEGK